ncbi:ClpXP protease specificity-enhancing factor [Amphritea sp. 1_MG-2023]|uniref:ClpXP protease specificity-enhancing factor n=1 Tax=Amphritea sp. 1_MG-2023 TaxID=3062670 RepID=UPI0026E297AB|nr:ClpXP protease specificity-enhancing factor [Amphritea sp. 1_MG-2023]MDO6562872.1 ClpXP protease specificity-enhancing factor [Amphritea sp. 1_MG-2023]
MQSSRGYLIRALNEWILDSGWTPHLVIDAEIQGVMVPQQFISDGQIVLNIAPSAVQNLLLDNEAVSFNARFGGVPMNVFVPIAAVMAIYARENGQGMGFGAEPGVEALFADEPETDPTPPEAPKPKAKSRPSLKVVK